MKKIHFFQVAEMGVMVSNRTMSIKKDFFAPLASELGATRRAATLLFVMLLTTMTAWANNPWWVRPGDSWDAKTRTLTVNSAEVVRDAYENRNEIEYVIISNNVTIIRSDAFNGCFNLKTVFVSSSVVGGFGGGAFWNCPKLKSIIVTNTKAPWVEYNSSFPKNAKVYVPADEYGNILQTYRQTNGWWPYNSDKKLVPSWSGGTCAAALNEGVLTVVGVGALTDYIGPDFRAVNLSVVIEDGVTSISKKAFSDCVNMTSINIPASVTSVKNSAFNNCDKLSTITVAAGNKTFDSRKGCNAVIRTADNTLVMGCKGTVIPDNVTSIGESAFHGCGNLTAVSIPASVTSIDDEAFASCTALESVALYTLSVPTLGEDVFENSKNGRKIYVFSHLVDAYKDAWGSYANDIESMMVGCGTCGKDNPEDVTWRLEGKAGHYVLFISGTGAMEDFTSVSDRPWNSYAGDIKTVLIGEDVTSIGDYAFANTGLTSLEIPASVTSIGYSAFRNCNSLTSVTIPASVMSISANAFYGCNGLKSVEIPASVTLIGNYAFNNCPHLSTVTTFAPSEAFVGDVFNGCGNLTYIYVLCKDIDSYKSAWSEYDYKDKISPVYEDASEALQSIPVDVTANSATHNPSTEGKPDRMMLPFSNNVDDGAIYDLSGHKVSNDYKGIVVKNGKKYMMR